MFYHGGAVTLNIKDPEVHELAKALSHETGETLTAVVKQALRRELESVRQSKKQGALLTDLIAMAKRGAELAPGPFPDHADLLYDENGLPK